MTVIELWILTSLAFLGQGYATKRKVDQVEKRIAAMEARWAELDAWGREDVAP